MHSEYLCNLLQRRFCPLTDINIQLRKKRRQRRKKSKIETKNTKYGKDFNRTLEENCFTDMSKKSTETFYKKHRNQKSSIEVTIWN